MFIKLKNNSLIKSNFLLHFIVLLWGFSPILGRFITASSLKLIWYRITFTMIIFSIYIFFTNKKPVIVNKKELLKLALIGFLITLHWLCFYQTIKISNVSISLATFSSVTLFTAIIEPILFKRKIIWYELILGITIIIAILLILSFEMYYWKGIILGIFAAFLSALFSVLNGLMVKKHSPITITYFELLFGLIFLSSYLLLTSQINIVLLALSIHDLIALLLLAGICTAIPFLSSIYLMNRLSPYSISLAMNMETVYGICLAVLIFHENRELSGQFYIGVLLILLTFFLNAQLKRKKNN